MSPEDNKAIVLRFMHEGVIGENRMIIDVRNDLE